MTAFIGIELDVVIVHTVGGVQAHHRIGREPASLNQPLEHALAVGIDAHRLGAHHLVFEDGGERPGQIPGLKERAPVDELREFAEVKILEDTAADELRLGRYEARPGRLRSNHFRSVHLRSG